MSILRALSVAVVLASPSVAAQKLQFDIPSQSAGTALTHLAQQAGVAVLFPYDEVQGVTTNEVVGMYTVEVALERMLAGTGLDGELNEQGVLTARLRQPPSPAAEGDQTMSTNERGGFWERVTATLGLAAFAGIPVQAQQPSASAQALLLEEVVVTARRREENLQDLPLSIQAITADAIEAQGIISIQDAGNFIPNVTLAQTGRANHTATIIRGIGGNSPSASTNYGSAMYVNGHYMPGRQSGFMSTLDIERIEVLRGPQGTLFGKNVTGGLVNIITARPGPEFEADVTLRAAEHGQQDIRGVINVPINESLFARVAASNETMDGYYYNRHLNIDAGAKDVTALNLALRWIPNENWTMDFSVNRQDHDDEQNPEQCNPMDGSASGMNPGALNNFFYPGFFDDYAAACASDAAQGLYVTSSDHVSFSESVTNSAFVEAQWDSGDAVGFLDVASVTIKSSWQTVDYDHYYDRDASFYDIGEMGIAAWSPHCSEDCGQDWNTRGFEVIFEATVNDRLEFTLGANTFYEKATSGDGACRQRFLQAGLDALDPVNPTVVGPQGGLVPNPAGDPDETVNCDDVPSGLVVAPHIGSPNPFIIQHEGKTDSIGVFGHLTFALTDNWDLDLGTRYTKDERDWWNFESAIDGCGTDDQSLRSLGAPTGPEQLCTFQYRPSFNKVFNQGLKGEFSDDWDDWTSTISLTRHLQGRGALDDGMVYFLISEGFLSGGFNEELNVNILTLAGQSSDVLSYGPEQMVNYEVGFKGTLLDGRLRMAADIFFMDYEDKQESIEIPNEGGAFGPADGNVGITRNIASAEISGIELELSASPWDGGFLSLTGGYLKNEYSSFVYPDPENPLQVVDATGDVIADLIPEWTLNLGIEHQFTLSNGASITPRMQIYAQDSYDFQPSTIGAASSLCNQGSYAKVDVRASYVPPSGNWRATIFGNNVTDEVIFETCDTRYGMFSYRHVRPAYWGVEFNMSWGG